MKASAFVSNAENKDSLPVIGDSLIGFATSDFYMQVPEGNLGNLVADAVKFYAEKTLNKKIDIALIASQCIHGHIQKGELYLHNIHNIFSQNDSIYIYKFPKDILQTLMDKVAKLGGMPCAGISFKILNMHAVDISLKDDTIKEPQPYFTLATTKNTLQRMIMPTSDVEMPLNATLINATYTRQNEKR